MNHESLPDLAASRAFVSRLVAHLRCPSVITLSGEMGVGKTQFVRWFLEDLGARDIASPTFAIHHVYDSKLGVVDHVDLYRVNSDADLEASGFWDLFERADGLVFVEWADRLPATAWPHHWQQVHLHLRRADAEARTVEFEIKPPSTKRG